MAVRTPGRAGALTDLVDEVRMLEGLTEQVGTIALPAGTCDRAAGAVGAVCATLSVPLTFDAPAGGRRRDVARELLAGGIRRAQAHPDLAGLDPDDAAAAAAAAASAQDALCRVRRITRPDGTRLTVLDAGPSDAPVVLLSPAVAMSNRLSLRWVHALRDRHRVLVPQTRGTSGPLGDPDAFDRRGTGVQEQADDLVAVLDELRVDGAHLMGLCGGVVPGLVVAAARPDLVASLSLWHGDLDLGPDVRKTDHQTNLRALLDTAGSTRDTAAWMRDRLTSGPMTGVPEAIGPLVVRPYTAGELFYRYARLVGATMHWDSRAVAVRVAQPCLVVTSRDDHTAHPDGSRAIARLLPDARLVVADHGTHLDAFDATSAQVSELSRFLAGPGPRFR